jgi:hypothetical protein
MFVINPFLATRRLIGLATATHRSPRANTRTPFWPNVYHSPVHLGPPRVSAWDHVDGGGYAGGQQRGAGGGTWVAVRIRHDSDLVLVGKHGANIEFLVAE